MALYIVLKKLVGQPYMYKGKGDGPKKGKKRKERSIPAFQLTFTFYEVNQNMAIN